MIKEIIINDFIKIRVWVGELPFECQYNYLVNPKIKLYNKYAVELKNGIRCNNNYALLGGIFVQDSSHKNIDVVIQTSSSFQSKYYSDYSALNDTPVIGINSEVFSWLNNFEACVDGNGELIINCVAFAPIGSSRNCFNLAYKLLLNIIDCQNNNLDFEIFKERCYNVLSI